MHKLTEKEIDEARKHLEEAETIFRKQSLFLAKVINDAHYTTINFLDTINSSPSPNSRFMAHKDSPKSCPRCDGEGEIKVIETGTIIRCGKCDGSGKTS